MIALFLDDAEVLFVVGVSPAGGQKGKNAGAVVGVGPGAATGNAKGRVLMPKPSALLGTPPLGVPVACVTPDSVIGSPQPPGECNEGTYCTNNPQPGLFGNSNLPNNASGTCFGVNV